MAPEDRKYCENHHEFAHHQGVMERALLDIDSKLKTIFGLIEKARDRERAQDKTIDNLGGYVKAYGFQFVMIMSLISIAVKLWR